MLVLAYNPRYASSVIEKLSKSAIANAENNNEMSARTFILKSVMQIKDRQ